MELNEIFDIGATLQYFKRAANVQPSVKGENFILESFKTLEYYFKKYEISTTIYSEITKWIKRFDENYAENEKLTDDDAVELRECAKRWIRITFTKLTGVTVIMITKTGALNQNALVLLSENKSSAFFDEKIWTTSLSFNVPNIIIGGFTWITVEP